MKVDFGKVQYTWAVALIRTNIFIKVYLWWRLKFFSARLLSSHCSGVSAALHILRSSFLLVFLCSLCIVSLTLSAWLMISKQQHEVPFDTSEVESQSLLTVQALFGVSVNHTNYFSCHCWPYEPYLESQFDRTSLIWSLSKSHRLFLVSLLTVQALFGASVNHTNYSLCNGWPYELFFPSVRWDSCILCARSCNQVVAIDSSFELLCWVNNIGVRSGIQTQRRQTIKLCTVAFCTVQTVP